MGIWKPDPSFYSSPRLAAQAPTEQLAYVAAFDPGRTRPDAIAVVDVAPDSPAYASIVGSLTMPHTGDELHHFGWNACSSCLCPNAPQTSAGNRLWAGIPTGVRTTPRPRSDNSVSMYLNKAKTDHLLTGGVISAGPHGTRCVDIGFDRASECKRALLVWCCGRS